LIRRFGVISAFVLALSGCYSFAGGGLPTDIRTVAVLPFINETATPELQIELLDAMREAMRRRLGLRDAPEARAHARVRGTIRRYDPDIPVAYSADPNRATTARRRLRLYVDIEIVDLTTGKSLLEQRGMQAEGEYAEGAEESGRRQAIEKLIADIIERVQSQW
jgi:hypothetical protein